MIQFAFVDADGLPTGGGSRPDLPDGAVELPLEFNTVDLPGLMYVSGEWQRRPVLPRPVVIGQSVVLSGLPDGTELSVLRLGSNDRLVKAAVAGVITQHLPKDGTFEVGLTGPRPWLGSEVVFVIGSGSAELVLRALIAAKSSARDQVNLAIGKARLAYITDIPAQQAIYAEKADEARAYVALSAAPLTLADFPLLAAEIGITAADPWQLSQLWLNMSALFKQVAAQTEGLRLGTIGQINAAQTLAQIDAILEEFRLK